MDNSDLSRLLAHFNAGEPVRANSELHELMHYHSNEALRITAKLNSSWHDPDGIREIMAELANRPIPASFRLFPPFYSEFGKNIHLGENVFINSCCCFQDWGGISLDDGVLVGHAVVIATINHGKEPADRGTNYPSPVRLGKNVWVGAHATILPGVSIGDNAIIAAGAVVTHDVPPGVTVGGVPARALK